MYQTAEQLFAYLEETRRDIDVFLEKLQTITEITDHNGLELMRECNDLLARVNGAYGEHQHLFDAENTRLSDAYRAFWNRIDAAQEV